MVEIILESKKNRIYRVFYSFCSEFSDEISRGYLVEALVEACTLPKIDLTSENIEQELGDILISIGIEE